MHAYLVALLVGLNGVGEVVREGKAAACAMALPLMLPELLIRCTGKSICLSGPYTPRPFTQAVV